MAKRNFKSRNTWSQVFLVGLSCILLIGAIIGVFALFKKSNDIAPSEGSIEYTYEETIENLNNEIEDNNAKISDLEKEIAKLENDLKLLNQTNSSLQDEINTKQNQIIDLQERLEAYDKEGKYEVTFQSNGVTQEVVLVESSIGVLTTEQILTLAHTQSAHFAGWSIDGSTIVDPTTINITANTTFIAVWRTIEGTWDFVATGYLSHYATSGELILTNEGIDSSSVCLLQEFYLVDSGEYYFVYNRAKDYLDVTYLADSDTIVVYGTEIGSPEFDFSENCIVGTATRIN